MSFESFKAFLLFLTLPYETHTVIKITILHLLFTQSSKIEQLLNLFEILTIIKHYKVIKCSNFTNNCKAINTC